MLNLSNSTLSRVPRTVDIPGYDRAAMQAAIVHLGIGNFHRAHQAVYTDHVLSAGDNRWGIIGASLRRDTVCSALAPQDFLYSLAHNRGDRNVWRVIGALKSVIHAQGHESSLINYMTLPSIRIISLTITEKGYCLDGANRSLDETHPDIVYDLQRPEAPRSAIGFLFAGLKRRLSNRTELPTILSCDNLSSNGATLRKAIIRFAEMLDRNVASQLDAQLECPSTMVDRIVPQTTDRDRRDAELALGVYDSWPVVTEAFSQWIIEDKFSSDRPDWAQFGAKFVSSVAPYEQTKLRLLNASHSAIAFLGLMSGFKTVSDVMNTPQLAAFIERMMRRDIASVLELPGDLDVEDYIGSLLSRFRNPALHHQLLQIASDSSLKIPLRLGNTIQVRLLRGLPLSRLAYVIAGFLVLLEHRAESGGNFRFHDPQGDRLAQSVLNCGDDDSAKIETLLSHREIFGSLGEHVHAKEELFRALGMIRRLGIIGAIGDFEKT